MGFLVICQAQQTQMYGRNPDPSKAKAISRCLQGSQDSTFNILIKAWKNTKQPHRLFDYFFLYALLNILQNRHFIIPKSTEDQHLPSFSQFIPLSHCCNQFQDIIASHCSKLLSPQFRKHSVLDQDSSDKTSQVLCSFQAYCSHSIKLHLCSYLHSIYQPCIQKWSFPDPQILTCSFLYKVIQKIKHNPSISTHKANNTMVLDTHRGFDPSCSGGGHFEVKVCKGERMSRPTVWAKVGGLVGGGAAGRKGTHRRQLAGDGASWRQHFYIWL